MINKKFFERFTTEELDELNAYIDKVKMEKEFSFPQKIADSEIPIRTKKHLCKTNLETWTDLANTSQQDIINEIKLSVKAVKEIYKELEKRNLKWND